MNVCDMKCGFCGATETSLSLPDALLADLENTGSPLPRCPVLLTSDPPQNADPTTQDPAQSRPPPPAYTPQQVVNPGHVHTSFLSSWLCRGFDKVCLITRLFCLLDRFFSNEDYTELHPWQIIQVTPS